ncbi:SDR family oxidoreductase [Corynebacterium renale]|uniref:NAD(P)H dehydrogenase (Quinone) n=1 Tax=Corynebacterium renale TaxID=1724 RepID=A0A2A9DQH0_9CORY|nr:SDR family oxidoreductase [Corynebacterium renale]PFG28843.1 NAD(P)H dehydrogenase (quinone) [Corynebacterium renale]SQI25667.1 predicted nucleoside-diphosphate-sugar epimerase [Corynebacterium renale]
MKIAVTGATGNLGGHVIQALQDKGIAADEIVAIVRNQEKAAPLAEQGIDVRVADYSDQPALTQALQSVERLVLVSGSEVGQRTAQHTNIIRAAQEAGVSLIAYTSLLNADISKLGLAPEHRETEALLRDSGIDYVLLRNGWYWENYAANLDAAKETGKFFGAAGDARVSGAARKDYAEAAARVVAEDGHAGKVYELAGSPALSYPQIAEGLGEIAGRDVEYVYLPEAEFAQVLEGAGLPAEVAQMIASWDPIIEAGALYSESTDLQDLIGRESTPFVEAVR